MIKEETTEVKILSKRHQEQPQKSGRVIITKGGTVWVYGAENQRFGKHRGGGIFVEWWRRVTKIVGTTILIKDLGGSLTKKENFCAHSRCLFFGLNQIFVLLEVEEPLVVGPGRGSST